MKIYLSIIFFVLPSFAFASLQISEGNVRQESCGFPESSVEFAKAWQVEFLPPTTVTALVRNKLTPVGKNISHGDALFYAISGSERKRVYYKLDSDIELIGSGLMGFDISLPKNRTLSEFGKLINKEHQQTAYTLLLQNVPNNEITYVLAVKDNGFLCSGRIVTSGSGYLNHKEFATYQKTSLTRVEDISATQNAEDTIALTLVAMDAISATINVKLLQNGQVIKQKDLQMDAMSGVFEFGQAKNQLRISFVKTDKSSIQIKAISEPGKYLEWLEYMKFIIK